MEASRQPAALSEALGVPDAYPFLQDCPENQLTPESLLNGYRISHEKDFGITEKGELELSLCGQQEQWDPSSLAGYRQVVLQQLRQVYRSHKAKHKAGVLYGVPLGGASLNMAMSYPQQRTMGEAARQQWVQDLAASSPLEALAALVPHGYMRGKLFEMLATQRVALIRAAWFVQVAYLNRTKPESWDGGSKLPTRSLQCTEDLLAYLEQAAAAVNAAAAAAPAPAAASAPSAAGPAGGAAVAGIGGAAAEEAGGPGARWQYMLRLTGGLYCQGLLHVPTLVGWLLGKATALPVASQLQLLPLLALVLREVSLSPVLLRLVVDACIKQASPLQPAGSLPHTASGALPGIGSPSSSRSSGGVGSCGSGEELAALRQGYAEVAAALLVLAPMAFTPLDQPTLSALGALLESADIRQDEAAGQEAGGQEPLAAAAEATELLRRVQRLQQQLASAVNPRVLRLQDSKAMQLLDSKLAVCDSSAAHAALLKALLPPAPSQEAVQETGVELVRLVCAWAVAHSPATMAVVLGGTSGDAAEKRWAEHGGLQPGRALLALAVLKHHLQQAQQPQQWAQRQEQAVGRAPGAGGGSDFGGPPPDGAAVGATFEEVQEALQGAIFGWLAAEAESACCAPEGAARAAGAEPGTSPQFAAALEGQHSIPSASTSREPAAALVSRLRVRRVHEWVVLLADSGLLSPSHYLRRLLASGVLPAATQRGGQCPRAAFHMGLLQELHPSLIADLPVAPSMPQQPRSPSPAPGPSLTGQKRKLGSEEPSGRCIEAAGGRGSVPASPFPAPHSRATSPVESSMDVPAAAPASQQRGCRQRQQQAQGLSAAASYAALRRAVLSEYGRPTGVGSECALLLGSLPSWSGSLSRGSSVVWDLECTSLDLDAAGGGAETSAATATATTTQQTPAPGAAPSAAVQQLKGRLGRLLALPGVSLVSSPGMPAPGESNGMQEQLWRDVVADIHALSAWQRRHLGTWLHGATRQKLGAGLPSPVASSSPDQAVAPTLSPLWLMNALGALYACGGHREAADVICDLLAALLRTVATAAVGVLTATQGAQAPASSLSALVLAAQDRFWRHTGLPPFFILRLVSAHHQGLAALGRAPRLLRMLTAGLWALAPTPGSGAAGAAAQRQQQGPRPQDPRQRAQQQAQQGAGRQDAQQVQQEVLSCCHAQLAVAGELLALYGAPATPPGGARTAGSTGYGGRGSGSGTAGAAPGGNSGVQLWVAEMEKQHGSQHWLLAALRRLAGEAAARAQPHQAQAARPQPGGAGRGAAAGPRGDPVPAQPRSSAAELAASLSECMASALKQRQQQNGSGQVAALDEAMGLLTELGISVQQAGSPQGPAPTGILPMGQAWEAADRLAAWVCAPVPSASPAQGGAAKQLQERAGVAVLALFLAHATAAAAMPQPAGVDAAGEWAAVGAAVVPEAACLSPFRDCLLRLGEVLARRQHLPAAFFTAVIVAASQHTQQQAAGGSVPAAPPLLLLAAVSHGLAPLDASLAAAATAGLAHVLVADPCDLPGLGIGESWVLAALQRSLPQHAATEALLSLHEGSGASALRPVAQEAQDGEQAQHGARLPISPTVQEACLCNPRQLYAAITRWELQQQQQHSRAYPARSAALWVLTGGEGSSCSNGDGGAAALNALLAHATPSALPLCWLVVRGMLDEQSFQAALGRGETPQSTLAAVHKQLAQAGSDSHAAPSEAEKDFTSRVLAELAVRPEAAATLCALCGEAGRGVGDYLLQQLDWVLQDADTLLGRQPLSAVLARRGALITTPAFHPQPVAHKAPASSAAATAWPTAQPAAASQQLQPGAPAAAGEPAPALQGFHCAGAEAPAFSVEQGFIEAALVCLAASSEARRRSFAHQLVQQLQRLADTVERLPLPGGASAASRAQQQQQQLQSQTSAGEQGRAAAAAWEAWVPGGQQEVGAASAQQPSGPRPGSGRAAGGFGWRGSSSGWGAGARGAQRGKPSPDAAGSVAGVQVGVWLRLGILFPLLPVVYSDTSPGPNNSLRTLLLSAVTRLLGSPYISAAPADWPQDDMQRQAAAAAAERAGEVLPARLLHVVFALASGTWASWLQGGRQLRDVPPFEGARQLAATIDGLPAPKRIKLVAAAALPAAQPALAVLPSAVSHVPVTPADAPPREMQLPKAATRADPWLLLPGGTCGSDPQQLVKQASGLPSSGPLAPHYLAGAVRVRKRDPLSYSFMGAS